jgi:hypothetical protein
MRSNTAKNLFGRYLNNKAREASETIFSHGRGPKFLESKSPIGDTKQKAAVSPRWGFVLYLMTFHGLSPVAEIVSPLRGCFGQHAHKARAYRATPPATFI